MKFHELWIKKYIKYNLNIKNIIKLLNNNGFEIKFLKLSNNKYYIFEKIISYKKIYNNLICIKIKYINKIYKIYIKNIKENIINKYIILYKNELKEKKFKYKKIQYYNNYIYILYKIKKKKKKIIKYINNNNIYEINIPYNKLYCNNIYSLSREISLLINKKINYYKNNIIKKKNKYELKINNINKNIINYKYLIIKNIKNIKKKIILKKFKKLKFLNIKIKYNILDVINLILIEFGQKNFILDLDKINKNNINKYNIIINKNIFLYQNIKKYYINKNTKNILILSPLFKYRYILKKNYIFNNNVLNKYISNNNSNIQNISLLKISSIIKKIYKGIIYKIKTKKNINIKNKFFIIKYKYIYNKIGIKINKIKIINILKQLNYKIIKKKYYALHLYIPKWRTDITIKENIIKDIINILNINKIPNNSFNTDININYKNNNKYKINKIKNILINKGYKEVINFIFTNKKKESIYFKKINNVKIYNPISQKNKLLRKSLLPNIIDNLLYNSLRKQETIKFFELGKCYYTNNNKIYKNYKLISIIYGYKKKNLWYSKDKLFNFYDIKGDLEYILIKQNKYIYLDIKKSNYLFLDKKYNANILLNKKKIGYIGMINEKVKNFFSLKYQTFLFEINIKYIINKTKNKIKKISKYINNIKDITLIINKNISIHKIINTCLLRFNKIIEKINIIKIYNNKLLKINKQKNITLRFNIKQKNKNFNKKDTNKIITKCKLFLKKKFSALIY